MYMMGAGGQSGNYGSIKDASDPRVSSKNKSIIPKPQQLVDAAKAKVDAIIPALVRNVVNYVAGELTKIIENPTDENSDVINLECTSIRKEFGYGLYETAIKSNFPKGMEQLLAERVIDIYRLAGDDIKKSGWNVEIVEDVHAQQNSTDYYPKLIISSTIDTSNT